MKFRPHISSALSISTALTAITVFTSCATLESKRIIIDEQNSIPDFATSPSSTDYSDTLNLSSIAERVVKNNPQLLAARLKIAEANGRLHQSGRLENPTLGISTSKIIPGYEAELEVSFAQRFPITNKLSLQKRVSADQLLIAREEIKIAEQGLISAAQLLAVEALHLDNQQAQIDNQIASLQKVTAFIQKAAALGELSSLDAAQTELKIQTLRIQKEQHTNSRILLTNKIKKYIGLPASEPLTVTGSLPPLSIPSRSLLLSNRADFRAKALEFQHSKSSILLEQSKRYDDVEVSVLGALGREEDAPDGLETEGTIGVGLSIPLPFYNKNEGNISAATAKAQRNLLERSALASEIRLQVATHKQEMQSWSSQNEAIKTKLLPTAKKTSVDLETAYKLGQGDFISFLKSKNQELEIQNSLIENNLKFYQARIKYFAALGESTSAL